MSVGHTIGNRSHIIEKKRDKDGRVRQQQKFCNMNEEDAYEFNNEFKSRVTQNLGLRTENSSQKAIESGRYNSNYSKKNNSSNTVEPIVTIPDEEDDNDIEYVGTRG